MSENGVHRKWKQVITPQNNLFSLNLKELWDYRDLLVIWMRRDFFAIYKQTILGPIWFFLQPLLTAATFVIIFSRVAKLKTLDLPPILFYLSGIVLWAYFSECITRTSTFFKDNSNLMGKVYFPRLIIPLSIVVTNVIKFAIQFSLFLVIFLYFYFTTDQLHPNWYILLLPVLVLLVAGLGLGTGMLISSLTTRYKDLIHLLTFGVQLLMFISPVLFPLSTVGEGKYRTLLMANPMTGIIETFRYAFLGTGSIDWGLLAYDAGCVLFFLFLGVLVFNSIEKSFVDTI